MIDTAIAVPTLLCWLFLGYATCRRQAPVWFASQREQALRRYPSHQRELQARNAVRQRFLVVLFLGPLALLWYFGSHGLECALDSNDPQARERRLIERARRAEAAEQEAKRRTTELEATCADLEQQLRDEHGIETR